MLSCSCCLPPAKPAIRRMSLYRKPLLLIQPKRIPLSAPRQPGSGKCPDSVLLSKEAAVRRTCSPLPPRKLEADSLVAENHIGKRPGTRPLPRSATLGKLFYVKLPKILAAICTLLLTWLLGKAGSLYFTQNHQPLAKRGRAITLVGICMWLFAIAIAIMSWPAIFVHLGRLPVLLVWPLSGAANPY